MLAAPRNGLRTIVMPAGNADELEEFPASVRGVIAFRTVKTVDEALRFVLGDPGLRARRRVRRP